MKFHALLERHEGEGTSLCGQGYYAMIKAATDRDGRTLTFLPLPRGMQMIADYTALVRAVADTLLECSADGLSAAQAALASHALRTVAVGLEDDSLDELLATLQSLADVMAEGRVSPSLAFLLGRAVQDALVHMDNLPHRHVVSFSRRR